MLHWTVPPAWIMHFIISNTAISWCSAWSAMVVLNTCATKVVSLSGTCHSSFYLRKLYFEFRFIQTSPTILCEDSVTSTSSTIRFTSPWSTTEFGDYHSAVALSKVNRFRNRSKTYSHLLDICHRSSQHSCCILRVVSISHRIQPADILFINSIGYFFRAI